MTPLSSRTLRYARAWTAGPHAFVEDEGYNVLVWDYRGFGKSDPEGVPTSEQMLADATRVLDEARMRAPDPERLMVYGYSAGSFPASGMLDDVCTLVLEAPFASLADAAEFGTRLTLPEQFFSTGQLDSTERVAAFDGPVFGMIGTEDEVVPGPDVVREMVEAGSGPSELWVVQGASHGIAGGGIPEDVGLTTYLDRIRGFVETHCP